MCRPNKIITRTNISFFISYVIIIKSNLKSNYHTTNILNKTMHNMQTYTYNLHKQGKFEWKCLQWRVRWMTWSVALYLDAWLYDYSKKLLSPPQPLVCAPNLQRVFASLQMNSSSFWLNTSAMNLNLVSIPQSTEHWADTMHNATELWLHRTKCIRHCANTIRHK